MSELGSPQLFNIVTCDNATMCQLHAKKRKMFRHGKSKWSFGTLFSVNATGAQFFGPKAVSYCRNSLWPALFLIRTTAFLYSYSYLCCLVVDDPLNVSSSCWVSQVQRGMRGGGLWEGGGKGAFSNWCTALSYKDNKKKKNRDNFLFPTMLTVAGIHYISVAGSDPTLNDIFKKFTFCKTLTRVWYRTMLKIVIQL